MIAARISTLGDPTVTLGQGSAEDRIIGTKISGPTGIESVFEFNGLYLNVRDWIDTYIVKNIQGLDDADVRDARENNPGEHGETPLDAYYGGRTIVLTGKIVAKTIWKLRDMEKAMRRAFADISQERPLIIRTGNVDTDMMIYCKKSQKIMRTDEQQKDTHFERDFQITLRASNPRILSYRRNYLHVTGADLNTAIRTLNLGSFEAQVEIALTGPMGAGTVLKHDADNQQIILAGDIPDGARYYFNPVARTFIDTADDSNVFAVLDDVSDSPEIFAESEDTWTFTGVGTGTNTALDFYWHHTEL